MKIKTTARKKKSMWLIMYSVKVNDFIPFEMEKLDANMSFETSIATIIQMTLQEFRHNITKYHNAKIKKKREPKHDRFFKELLEPEENYTEIYFENKEDAEKAIDWIRGILLMYKIEHPTYKFY